jgi:phage-related protein
VVIIIISVYDSKCADFNNNGLVVLSDCISCVTEEELNGMYECTIEYPLDKRGKWQYLIEGNIVKVDGQLFRIYNKVKKLNRTRINCRHIFYDLLDNFIESATIGNLNAAGALSAILSNTQYAHDFTSMSDIATASGTEASWYEITIPLGCTQRAGWIGTCWYPTERTSSASKKP